MRPLRLLAPLALLACATPMTGEDCGAIDWRGLGYAAGLGGGAPGLLDDYRYAQCAEAGVPADPDAYFAGYEDGLARYCTFDGVLEGALRGRGDVLSCPDATYAMEEAFDAGRAYHEAERERDAAEEEVREARRAFRAAVAEADRLRGKLPYIDDPDRRAEIRRDIERRRDEAYRAEQRGREAEFRYGRARDRLRDAARRLDRLRARADELRRLDAMERSGDDAPRGRATDTDEDAYPALIGE